MLKPDVLHSRQDILFRRVSEKKSKIEEGVDRFVLLKKNNTLAFQREHISTFFIAWQKN
jgi:hypothetical protein